MLKRILVVASLTLAGWSSAARAGAPAWCKGEDFKASPFTVRNAFGDADVRSQIRAVVEYSCSSDKELDASRPELEKRRADISKQAFMNDADWSDAVAYVKNRGSDLKIQISEKTIAALTPIDQFVAIKEGFRNESGYDMADPQYLADALEGVLTETGRLGFLASCNADDAGMWAICRGDVEKFDGAKFAAELRGDTAHPPEARTALHVHAYNILAGLAVATTNAQKFVKRDDAYKKLFDAAAKGRADWATTLGTRTDLLALAQAMDSAVFFHSRKQLAGCEDKTGKALADAVSKIPAKAFTGMHDVRDDPAAGFAQRAALVLINDPQVNLAATAYALCKPKSGTGDYLSAYLQRVPGVRGPRGGAFGAIFSQKFELDDTKAKEIRMPKIGARPYSRSGGTISSAGGVVKSIKPAGDDKTIVTLEATKIKQEDCIKEHRTNRIVAITSSGGVEYERICDKTAIVEHDNTWSPFEVSPATTKWLKAGVVFSAVGNSPMDVVAVWPSKTAKLPSLVLGGTIK